MKPMLKVIPTVAAIASASAVTSSTMGMGIVPFLTEGWLTKQSSSSDNSWEISLKELFSKNMGMDMRTNSKRTAFGRRESPVIDAIGMNLKANGVESIVTLIGATVVPKLLAKTGITRNGNKLLKSVGLGSIVQL
tara:strand:+ start:183 stop:587 length:405 start_codon:yes stop_codon:yes gene_type:complete